MNQNGWLYRIPDNIRKKREQKLRERYGFLFEELKEADNQTKEDVIQEVNKLYNINYETLMKEKTEITEKLFHADEEIKAIIHENYNQYKEHLQQVNKELKSDKDKMLELLRLIISRMEKTEYDVRKWQSECSDEFKEKADIIENDMEEIKALLKILAVNNLIDDINV